MEGPLFLEAFVPPLLKIRAKRGEMGFIIRIERKSLLLIQFNDSDVNVFLLKFCFKCFYKVDLSFTIWELKGYEIGPHSKTLTIFCDI